MSELEKFVDLFKALADPTRLRLLGLVTDRARCGQELASTLGISPATVSHHLRVLRDAGLLVESRERPYTFYGLDLAALQRAMAAVSERKQVQDFASGTELSEQKRKVLRNFFEGRRLLRLPAQRSKKEVVIEEILRRLPRRKVYGEKELSRFLETIYPDFATLRRELIMGRYMERSGGEYRWAERGQRVVAGRRGAP